MMVKNVETLTWLAANITPATIEIIEPLNFSFTAGDLQGWLNDVLSTMHSIGYAHKTQNAELQFIKGQLRTLVENTILINLAKGGKKPSAISKETSLDIKAVEAHLGSLEKAGRVKKDGDLYSLAK
jgi:predicted Rossmann fold nucleotide-binding protein DprA/Smf involved in DNA uptake